MTNLGLDANSHIRRESFLPPKIDTILIGVPLKRNKLNFYHTDRVPESRGRRGCSHLGPRSQGGTARPFAQEDWRRHRQGHTRMEGPQGNADARRLP